MERALLEIQTRLGQLPGSYLVTLGTVSHSLGPRLPTRAKAGVLIPLGLGTEVSPEQGQEVPLGVHPAVLPKSPLDKEIQASRAPVTTLDTGHSVGRPPSSSCQGKPDPDSQPVSPVGLRHRIRGNICSKAAAARPSRKHHFHSWFHCPHGTDGAPGSLSCPRSHMGKKQSSEPAGQPCAQRGVQVPGWGRGAGGNCGTWGGGSGHTEFLSQASADFAARPVTGGGVSRVGCPGLASGEGPPARSWGPGRCPASPSQSPGQDGSPWKASPSLAPQDGRCGCEGPARSEQRPRARVCPACSGPGQGCFQPCVYDDGGEELSAETLTQPGTSGVGAGWGRRGRSEGQRDGGADGGGGMRAGTGRASQQEGPGEGDTHGSQAGPRPPLTHPGPGSRRLWRQPRVLSTSGTLTPLPGPREVVGGFEEATGSKSLSAITRGSRRGPLSQNP